MTEPRTLPIRPGMDVYTTRQDGFIGTVVRVIDQGADSRHGGPQEGGSNPTGSEQHPGDVRLAHEEGGSQSAMTGGGKRVLGEELGVVATMAFGNSGPDRQSARHAYSTRVSTPVPRVVTLVVRPGRLNLGMLTRSLYIPAAAVQAVAMDRILLDVERGDIPVAWRKRPPV